MRRAEVSPHYNINYTRRGRRPRRPGKEDMLDETIPQSTMRLPAPFPQGSLFVGEEVEKEAPLVKGERANLVGEGIE